MSTPDLIPPAEIFLKSLIAKTRGLIPERITHNLERCGREEIYRTCDNCGDTKTFYYRCSQKFCPNCNWLISRRRSILISTWAKRIAQPKHLVLTRQNFETLTRRKIHEHHKAISAMRRSKLWKNVTGGCASTEITHEGRGWHLHTHLLLDVRWMDMPEVSRQWGKRVGQEFAIVKIKDARGNDYLGEITKYVVKPSELSRWDGNLAAQFIHAIRKTRFFATFGRLFHEASQVRAEINLGKPVTVCNCGCSQFNFIDEWKAVARGHKEAERRRVERKRKRGR